MTKQQSVNQARARQLVVCLMGQISSMYMCDAICVLQIEQLYGAADRADAASKCRATGSVELLPSIPCQQGAANSTNACGLKLTKAYYCLVRPGFWLLCVTT